MVLRRGVLIALVLTSVCFSAQVVRYVDPDASGANDGTSWTDAYESLDDWNTGEATNLVTDGDYHTCYCRSSGGTKDTITATVLMDGWTTGAANYIEIIGNDFPSDGIFDGTKYVFHATGNLGYGLSIKETHVRLHNLQFEMTVENAEGMTLVYYDTGVSDLRVDSCIFKGNCSGTGAGYGIRWNDQFVTIDVYNCVFYDFVSGADTDFVGIHSDNGIADIYNCTVYNCYYGIERDAANTTIKNCVVGNCTDDFVNILGGNIDYSCSDDGDGTNSQGPAGGSWANEFTNVGSGDFSLKTSGNCVDNGTDDPSSGVYSDDIIGTARTSPWDIGAYGGYDADTSTNLWWWRRRDGAKADGEEPDYATYMMEYLK